MRAEIVRLTSEGMCEARTTNDLLVVFRRPAGRDLQLSDVLDFHGLALDADVVVENAAKGYRVVVHVSGNDIHDLRLPAAHGSNRTPSTERLRGS
jgi:hypothetical protein